jgi:hypothetical protein
MGLDEVQHRKTSCTNMKKQKSKTVKLWVTRMSNTNYQKKLVELMLRRLTAVIKKENTTTT